MKQNDGQTRTIIIVSLIFIVMMLIFAGLTWITVKVTASDSFVPDVIGHLMLLIIMFIALITFIVAARR